MTDTRPSWGLKISERDFEKMDVRMKGVRSQWKFISEDQTENWWEFSSDLKTWFRSPPHWRECFEFSRDEYELLTLTYKGREAREKLQAIRSWEKKNARDRSEYERLKKKFGDVQFLSKEGGEE